MGREGVASFTAEGNCLSFFYRIALLNQCAIVLEVPVTGTAPVAVLNNNIVALWPEFLFKSAFVAVFFHTGYNAFTGGTDGVARLQVKIKSCSFFMGEAAKITLYYAVIFPGFIRERIYITGIIFNDAFAQQFDLFPQGVVAYIAGAIRYD